MIVFAIPFPDIPPVAFEFEPVFGLGPISVKWYGLAYVTGLLLGWLYIRRLLSTPRLWPQGVPPFSAAKADDFLIYVVLGVILGGRLGSVLFYNPGYYWEHPLEVLFVWEGGMAFHGALIGCALGAWAFSVRNKVNTLSAMDLGVAAVPIGLFFGRLANFVNGELYGRPSDVPWAMVFPSAVRDFGGAFAAIEPATRHPSQVYEAFLEGIVLFLVLRVITHVYLGLKRPGLTSGAFLAGYGLARSFAEFFRQPDPHHALTVGVLTPGIVFSIPMILAGVWLLWRSRRQTALAGTAA
jgi:phosphatidylglycerol:prolipoprotein diacylglycerol transferase